MKRDKLIYHFCCIFGIVGETTRVTSEALGMQLNVDIIEWAAEF